MSLVKNGLAKSGRGLGDPMTVGPRFPAWYEYPTDRRFSLLRGAVELLEAGEKLTNEELDSLQELKQTLWRTRSFHRREMELKELSNRLTTARISASVTAQK
jgi:MoxR-like ATPase